MKPEIKECIEKVQAIFPKAYIYKDEELIIEPTNNIYFRLPDINNALEFKCKMIEWLSRPAHKGLSVKWQAIIREGLNRYLGTEFTESDFDIIYTYLGNCVDREKTIKFIESGYAYQVLTS